MHRKPPGLDQVGWLGAGAGGVERGMLEQPHYLTRAAGGDGIDALRHERARLLVGHEPWRTEPLPPGRTAGCCHLVSRHGRHFPTSLTSWKRRARKPHRPPSPAISWGAGQYPRNWPDCRAAARAAAGWRLCRSAARTDIPQSRPRSGHGSPPPRRRQRRLRRRCGPPVAPLVRTVSVC